ncbi:MAG: tetratricopeptide repeat protein, partial [Chloroflexota bacterium]|nr:tetratricopeptide repeat protein [Chloroflexota bacterium]
LETIREYAGEKLVERGEEEEVRAAHAAYFLQLAETAEAELQGPGQAAWLVRLDGELDNLRAVLSWYLDQGKSEQALRLASALYRFWSTRGYWSEGRRWLEDGLANGEDATGAVRATAIWRLGSLVISIGDLERARRLEEEALGLFQALGDRNGLAGTLNALGMIADEGGNYDVATERYQACLELYRGLGDARGTAAALVNLGVVSAARLDHDEAKRLYEEALPLCRQIGDRRTLGTCLNNLGVTARAQGNLEEARGRFEESLVVSRELGRKDAIAFTLGNLAGVELQQGAYGPAADGLRESLLLSRELGDLDVMLALLGGTAELAVVVGAFERAACLGGAETALRQVSGIARQGNDRAGWDRTMERAHRELGEEEWNRAWAAGQAMSLDDVLAYALDEKL